MPELPEAETIVRGLRRSIVSERIRRVEAPHPDVLRQKPKTFANRVRGRTIEAVGRRGKNVLLEVGEGDVIAVNLGMTGRLLPFPAPPPRGLRPTHPAVVLRFASGGLLVFDDQRRFGTVEALGPAAWQKRSQAMGPEPLARSFTARRLHGALADSRAPVRSWLLDQRRIAGVGNIYANEALHHAGVHPQRPANGLDADEATGLHAALRGVLRKAIAAGGTTLRDYRNADGSAGGFAPRLEVYGREGEPCRRCGEGIERLVFGGRSAFVCAHCQPRKGAGA